MGINFSHKKYDIRNQSKTEKKAFITEIITNPNTKMINDILQVEIDGYIYNIDKKGNIYCNYKEKNTMDFIGCLSTFGFTQKEINLLFSNKYIS